MEQNYQGNMNITAKVFPVREPRENLLAFASLNLGNGFAVQGVKVLQGKNGPFVAMVLQGKNGPFVAMPQMKNSKGEWHDIAFPTTKEGREAVNKVVLEEYQKVKDAPAKEPVQQSQPQQAAPQQSAPQQSAPQRDNYAR